MTFPYESPVEPESVNINPGRLARVAERFHNQQQSGAFPGGQLVLRRYSKLVLNQAIGAARGFRADRSDSHMPVEPQTPFPVFSAGKPLAAIAIALLEERGGLDVHAPIIEIFPGFARHGKERITTLDVLTHRSGILMPDFAKNMSLWGDREAVQNALIETVPFYPQGTLAYAPYEFGWILSEIVLRVDGRTLPDFFAEEIAAPLQLPALQFGLAGRDLNTLAFSYWLGKDKVIIGGTNVAENFEQQNSAQFFNAQNPSNSLVSDAASLAGFYDFLLSGGKTKVGQQLLSEQTIRQYTSRHVLAWNRSYRTVTAMGRGFMIGTLMPSSFGWWNTGQCFGHGGGFCAISFGDHSKNLSIAIVTNGNRSLNDFPKRFLPLAHGLRQACNE
jgi:CubicO group peptidase (beta-lactamase class C family)